MLNEWQNSGQYFFLAAVLFRYVKTELASASPVKLNSGIIPCIMIRQDSAGNLLKYCLPDLYFAFLNMK